MDFIVNERPEGSRQYSRQYSVDAMLRPPRNFSPRTVSEVPQAPKKQMKLKPKLKSEFAQDKAWFICNQGFNQVTRKRHHCVFCANSVCDKHSQKRKKMNNSELRCCDACDRALIEDRLRCRYEGEIQRLQEILQRKTQEVSDAYKESIQATASKNRQQKLLDRIESEVDSMDSLQAENLALEIQKSQDAREAQERIQSELQESSTRKEELLRRCTKMEKKVTKITEEIEQTVTTHENLKPQIEELRERKEQSLEVNKVCKTVCKTCKTRIETLKRKNKNYGNFDGTNTCVSIEESIDEYRDSESIHYKSSKS